MSSELTNSRRAFLLRTAAVAGALPLVLHDLRRPAHAQDLPKLPLDNATAKALAYAEDASKVAHASFKPGSDCANCNFIQGNDGDARRPCTLFAGYSVASAGWCSAWAAKA